MFDKSCQIPKRFDFCNKKYILNVKKYFTIIIHNFMDTNLNSINSSESLKDSQKSRKFLENTKKAVRNTLTAL